MAELPTPADNGVLKASDRGVPGASAEKVSAGSASPICDEKGETIGTVHIAKDITERKCAEEALRESEQRVRLKLESVLSPEGDVGTLDLVDIIDAPAIQSLMDDFCGLTHIPMAIIDLKGRVLVGVGWQDICTKFHRVHPETCKHCIESDLELSDGVLPGESRLYKCKNNMWDIATPIMVGSQHVGNVFSGQFFFEGEPLDYELFRSQARQYGFDEEEYIAALEAVPRLRKESVDRGMAFLTKLAHMLSQLSYSNIKLARSLAQRGALMDSLRESEELFRLTFDRSPVGATLATVPERRFLRVNEAFSRFIGYSREELTQMAVQDVTHPDDLETTVKEVRRILAGEISSFAREKRYIRKDGTIVWGHLSVQAVKDNSGRILYTVGIVQDITERKLSEQTLRESEQKYRDLAELLPQTVFETDIAGRITFVNNHGLEHIGFSREDFQEGIWLSQVISPEDRPRALDSIRRVLEGEGPPSEEYTAVKKDGSKFPVIVSSTPIIKQGTPLGLRGIVTDISQLKQAVDALKASERRYRTLVESSSDAILMLDTNRDILSCNNAFLRLFGYERGEVEGKSVSIIHVTEKHFRAYGEKAYPEVEKEGFFRTEWEFIRKDGHLVPVESVTSAIRDENGHVTGFVGIIRDITARRQAEEQIKASLVEKEALLKEIHHRVKNNLQIISSLLHLEARRHPEAIEALTVSRGRVRSMALIHEKLYQSPSLARVDMADYAKSLTNYILELYNKPGRRVRVRVAAEGVSLDAEKAIPCGLIINELVSNALKYAFPEGRAGEIGVSLRQKNGDGIALVIRDDGIGLPDHLDFRNSASLGLSLVCNLTQQLNGTIELGSKAGTTFTISFQPNRPPP